MTRDILFRASSIGRLMTEPRSKAEGPLSIGAKTFIRQLAAEAIFGVQFEVSSKPMEKGILVEADCIDLLNRVRGLALTKNSERRRNDYITGEADLVGEDRGHDIKAAWSVQTFPICAGDCADKVYEWQMRCYMALWDLPRWEVNYCLVDTPDHLIGWEPPQLHVVGHLPEHMRVTTWTVERDKTLEYAMWEKVRHARDYYRQVVAEFDKTHPCLEEVTA
jgi:hypothetical protein